jgi:hypothetical protein
MKPGITIDPEVSSPSLPRNVRPHSPRECVVLGRSIGANGAAVSHQQKLPL